MITNNTVIGFAMVYMTVLVVTGISFIWLYFYDRKTGRL